MYFSEIIKLQSRKKIPYIALYFGAFWKYCCLIIAEKCLVTYLQFSFWISVAFAKICFPRIVVNRTKILRY